MWFAAVLALVGASMVADGARAEPRSDESVLRTLWSDPESSRSLFHESFLRQVPIAQIAMIVTELGVRCGDLEAVNPSGDPGHYVLQTAKCEISASIQRLQSGEIRGLRFSGPARRDTSLDDVLDALKRFDGTVSYAVFENGELIAGEAPHEPLAVGSAFKLVVLAALHERIEAGDARWADVLSLTDRHLSLPTGRLRNMPPGSPLTLHTLAASMIAESDNTATDVLIEYIGRDRLEALSGLAPFLTTREFFQLKSDPDLYDRYAAAEPSERHALLAEQSSRPLPRAGEVLRPLQPHAEWRLSTAALCGWMAGVAELGVTQINPGPVDTSRWERVSYKGGGEVGVLNLTAAVRDRTGREFCVSATWNATRSIDATPLVERYATLFLSLHDRSR